MELNELEKQYGEKILTQQEFSKLPEYNPNDPNDKFNNTVGIVKCEANDSSPAFRFGFIGKTPEWICRNIFDNTNQVNKKVKVGTIQSNHVEDHVEWLDKETGFSYFDFNASTNTLIVALSVWYAFYIETGFNFKQMQNFFSEQMKYNFDIEPDNVTMLSLLMNEKIMTCNENIDRDKKKNKLNEMDKLKEELNAINDKINKLSSKYNK